ncbi:MAG: fluoride efflux transporter CrcB [Phycisphaerales bacterium]|nr:fluoride efflux transporter CrcB [Phycisphaerales bacterium]
MWTQFSMVALGGAAGAMGRFGITQAVTAWTGWPSYAATMISNVLGCCAIGVMHVVLESSTMSPSIRALLVVGLVGAVTTFSTFSHETMVLLDRSKWGEASLYVLGSIILGLIAVKVGMIAGRGLVIT